MFIRTQIGRQAIIKGSLSVGFRSKQHNFGPELGFGFAVGDALEDGVLLIKTAWGGASLDVDFQPSSTSGNTGQP